MKPTRIILFVLICFIAIAACKKESDKVHSPLFGTWHETKSNSKFSSNGQLILQITGPGAGDSIKFNDNGTGAFMHWDTTNNFKYQLTGNTLILSQAAGSQTYSVDSLTEKNFILRQSISHTGSDASSYDTENDFYYSK